MKNINFFQYSILVLSVFFLFTGCQNFDEPEFGNYPLDGPIITLNTPSSSGLTIIRSVNPTASITFNFQVEDDIEISSIIVSVDGIEIANMNQFLDSKIVVIDNLVYDASTGTHTLIITATDSDGNIVTEETIFTKEDTPPYVSPYAGEMFYMNFEDGYADLVSNMDATEVGTPGFAGEGRVGNDAYAGATDSYLTFPTNGLVSSEFSASMWYKINANPDRAGILVIGPEDTGNANYPDSQNKRTSGFRFFRESANGGQTFKLNVGNGTADSWFDGGAAATIDPATTDWVHLAFTISGTECVVYINGQVVKQGAFAGVDWTGCDIMSIMSGAPRFTEWGHKSDLSYMDDLQIFDRALAQEEIQALMQ